jgi:sigma-B regulation protein RsbU (phosphoserine phosphatase)
VLTTLATIFAIATALYSAVWMYHVRHGPSTRFGAYPDYSPSARSLQILSVDGNSPAARAGLQPGDRIVAINERPLDTLLPYYDAISRGLPGDVLTLDLERADSTRRRRVQVVLQPRMRRPVTPAQTITYEILNSYPLLFLIVGLVVLLQRREDRNAWLLALLFAGFIASAPLFEERLHPLLRGPTLFYRLIFAAMMPALFYFFFAVFPVSSPLDRRVPWLKWLLLIVAAAVAVPLAVWTLSVGHGTPVWITRERFHDPFSVSLVRFYNLSAFGLGLASLVWNLVSAPSAEVRRKINVIVWGAVLGTLPIIVVQVAANNAGKPYYEFPAWIWQPAVVALFLLPLSFAYAVVKHRVLEIPVLLKRSARYVLVQRGVLLLIVLESIGAALIFAVSVPRVLRFGSQLALPAGLFVGVGFGIVLAWTGVQTQRRVTRRIDRAFFRSAYDARQILEDLATRTREAASREELAALMEPHLRQALHPRSLAIYLETGDGHLGAMHGGALQVRTVPASLPAIVELARRGQPWDVAADASPQIDLSVFAPLEPECLVPMLGRARRLVGLLILGPRLSEEPYSREDKRLLASISSQAGVALENIALAERMAERLEAERRAARDMDIAKEVQRKLFPQRMPPLDTLEYAGACIQARAVGGDYYDFLDLGAGRVGFVLADISGKGISAALLMANLQANLRSQYALALDNLAGLLRSVNHLLYESTAPNHYSTLFFAMYDDATRRLRYANCGHNPPLVLRASGEIDRLPPTAAVIGLFDEWTCTVAETRIEAGDTLVIFTDGVTEAMRGEDEEFGEERLFETIRGHADAAPSILLSATVSAVKAFSGAYQSDDLTLVIARGRS